MSKTVERTDAKRLVSAYENGATLAQLSEVNDISLADLREILSDAGVVIKKGRRPSVVPPRLGSKTPPKLDDRSQRMKTLYEEGKTLQEIGTEFDLSRERVRQILRGANVESQGRRKREDAPDQLSTQDKKIARLYDKGTPPSELIVKFDINYSHLQTVLRRAGIDVKPKGFFNRRPGYEGISDGIIRDYKSGVDTQVIADRYGLCGRTEIYKFIKREGVEPRVFKKTKKRITLKVKEAKERKSRARQAVVE
jgi:uncharacterized protein (DUF433 family)